MKIKTHLELDAPAPVAWQAWDEDSYDGAPDAAPSARIVGTGTTKQEAIADLMAQYDEIAHQKWVCQQLDAADSEDERNAILRENTQ
jgi:hypothetical protein